MTSHTIASDATRRPRRPPTHFHCYRWSASGQEWNRLGRTDSLDLHSPDRPPDRTVDWLIKSPRFIQAAPVSAGGARDWLISEWQAACEKALNPVPEWANNQDRPVNALRAIETGCWPTYTQWLAGGTIVFMSVVGTDQACH